MALLQRGEVSLTRWLPYLPCRGEQAQSKQRRVSRWLHNSRINVHRLYKPLILAALANWQEECLYLSLDTSTYTGGVLPGSSGSRVSWSGVAPGVASVETSLVPRLPLTNIEKCCIKRPIYYLRESRSSCWRTEALFTLRRWQPLAMTWAGKCASASRAIPGFGWPVQVGGN